MNYLQVVQVFIHIPDGAIVSQRQQKGDSRGALLTVKLIADVETFIA